MIASPRPVSGPDVAEYYDELDSFYREAWGERLHHGLWLDGGESVEEAIRKLEDLVLATASVDPGETVVDIGCGYGVLTERLAAEFGAKASGFTLSSQQFERAAARGGQASFRLCDWLENDLANDSTDCAISVECFSHITDKRRFLREIARVLRPGGRLTLVCWTAPESSAGFGVDRTILGSICGVGRLAGIATDREIRTLLDECGFENIASRDLSFESLRTWPAMGLKLAKLALSHSQFARQLLSRPVRTAQFAAVAAALAAASHTGRLGYGLYEGNVETAR